MRGFVVRQGGDPGVAIGGVTTGGAAGGVTGDCEAAQVLRMDRLVALQHLDSLVDLEPLPFPTYVDRILPVLQGLCHSQDIDVRPVFPVLVVFENPQ